MAMAWIWSGMLLLAVLAGAISGQLGAVSAAAMAGAERGAQLCLSLAGPLCLWAGLAAVLEGSGLSAKLATLLRPLLGHLFPVAARDAQTLEKISGNFTANLLGLGNAATPLGIAAVQRMHRLSGGAAASRRDVPPDRAEYCVHPAASDDGRCLARVCRGCPALCHFARCLAHISGLCHRRAAGGEAVCPMAALTDAVVPLLLLGVSCYSLRKRADSYGLMVRGAADGLRMLAHIAPALIVLLTAVQMLQAAGAVQLLERFLGPVLAWTGIPPQTLGLVLIRPISGSAGPGRRRRAHRPVWPGFAHRLDRCRDARLDGDDVLYDLRIFRRGWGAQDPLCHPGGASCGSDGVFAGKLERPVVFLNFRCTKGVLFGMITIIPMEQHKGERSYDETSRSDFRRGLRGLCRRWV